MNEVRIHGRICAMCGFSASSQDPERALLYLYEHFMHSHNVSEADLPTSEPDSTMRADAEVP